MIGYVTLGTNDREKSAKFYDALCGEFGVGRMMENEQFIAWGKPDGGAGIGLTRPFDGNAASVGNGVMVALQAKDKDQVQRLYDLALANGGTDEGAPGLAAKAFMPAISAIPTATTERVRDGRRVTQGKSLYDFPIHLGLGARAVSEPQFTGLDWYDGYDERHRDDLDEGRLVSLFRFEESWTQLGNASRGRGSRLLPAGPYVPAPGTGRRVDAILRAGAGRLCDQPARDLAHCGRNRACGCDVHHGGKGDD